MDYVQNWCTKSKLNLNNEKTNLLYIHHKPTSDFSYKGRTIAPANDLKILGVTFGDHRNLNKLNYTVHVKNCINQVNKSKNYLLAFAKKSWGIDFNKRLVLYKTIFRPKLLYASSIWYSHINKTTQKNLDSTQYKLLKLVSKKM